MEKIIRLTIVREKQSLHPSVDHSTFEALVNVANSYGMTKLRNAKKSGFLHIVTSIKNEGLKYIFEIMNDIGLNPNFSGKGNGFRIRVKRVYDTLDIDNSPLLYLPPRIGSDTLCDFEGRNGNRWIGKVECFGEDSGDGWNQPYGSIGENSYFISNHLKIKLEELRLVGLRFHELQWDLPDKAQDEYWELSSNITLPQSLQNIREDNGVAFFEDECFEPTELYYDRHELAEVGEFDFALTKEPVGYLDNHDCGNQLLVVSQRGRQALGSIGIEIEYHLAGYSKNSYDFSSFLPGLKTT